MTNIRFATWHDMPAIREIINYYIENTTILWYPVPHDEEWMASWYSAHLPKNRPVLVAEREGKVIGYASLSSFRTIAYSTTAESSIYLKPEAHQTGLGTSLMTALIESARASQLKVILAFIDSENHTSISFHKSLDFTHAGYLADVGIKNGISRSVVILRRGV